LELSRRSSLQHLDEATSDIRPDFHCGRPIHARRPSKDVDRGERATRRPFGAGGIDMKVLELDPAKRVLWQVVDGPDEWIGTTVSFDLKQEGDWTLVFFKHQGWKEPVEFMHHCSTKWAVFLLA
jgi:hypothetical protein